jgi:hypothetical protein
MKYLSKQEIVLWIEGILPHAAVRGYQNSFKVVGARLVDGWVQACYDAGIIATPLFFYSFI